VYSAAGDSKPMIPAEVLILIKCHLSRIMGDQKLKVAELSRETGINKNTLHRMYRETASRIELDVLETLCRHLDISVADLYEIRDE
jgi:putative transcriptional regulator